MNPWERDWGTAAPAQPPTGATTAPKPWERDWGASQAATPQKVEQPASGLDGVWKSIVSAGPVGSVVGLLGNAAKPDNLRSLGMGMGDPMVGLGQAASHAGLRTPITGMPEFGMAPLPEGTSPLVKPGEIDQTVQRREQQYQQQRQEGQPGSKLGTDWYRILGNVASPVNVAAGAATGGVGGAGSTLGRIGVGALRGALGGAAGGATQPVTSGEFGTEKAKQAGEGALGGTLAGGAMSGLARAITGKNPAEVENFIRDTYQRAVKPSFAGPGSSPKLDNARNQAREAIDLIVQNKPNLSFEEGAGRLPASLEEFGQAIDQTKRGVFKQYDKMARDAGDAGATVKLNPIAAELRKLAEYPEVQDLNPGLVRYAETKANALDARQQYSTTEAQRAVENYNQSLSAFYRNPNYKTAARANIDSLIANQLRKGLDEAIESAVAPGYQQLKSQYGSLKSIENDVVKRAQVHGRQNPGGGLVGNFSDVFSISDVVRGLMTMNPKAIAEGIGLKYASEQVKYLRGPNRAIRRIFQAAEQGGRETPNTGALTPGAGAAMSYAFSPGPQ